MNELIDWTKSSDDKIKFYSGSAVYHNEFSLSKPANDKQIIIDLGTMYAMATIKINGIDAGGVWTAPYQLNITKFVKPGTNAVDITVTNTWVNRLIGDLGLPEKERKTWVNVNPYNSQSPLETIRVAGAGTDKVASIIFLKWYATGCVPNAKKVFGTQLFLWVSIRCAKQTGMKK